LIFDPTFLLVVPALLLSLYAQHKVKSTFDKFTRVASQRGMTGAEVAAQLLNSVGIRDVKIQAVPGHLTDHYDPRDKVVRLSEAVYNQRSLAALGVAAHEVGHAIQHNDHYGPLAFRTGLFPVVSLGSNLSMPLIFIGILLTYSGFGTWLLYAGILLFSFVVLFQLVTLPVEFNASTRAIAMLEGQNILGPSETGPAKKVLDAAALIYLAVVVASLLNLLRFVLIARRR